MKILTYVSAVVIACMSCALGGCTVGAPDEEETEESVGVNLDEGSSKTTTQSLAQPEEDATGPACGGNGNWCLARCSKTGDNENVVGGWGALGGTCAGPGETYCQSHNLGYRTHACWGHL